MVGSLAEWTADMGGMAASETLDSGYGSDMVEFDSDAVIPTIVRGGSWNDGSGAGTFAFTIETPSAAKAFLGFRCGRRR